ncbi:hypothetical protein SETIT_5G185700v2 [Setaria italica]|uniref:RING-type domain-containing protein n=1 Tax=Setaria italica TaxID=4555 RepID=K3XR29_SETIT|nr:E3 ubiquitin-protein ligase RNF149 [Setaria italica]RCV25696.1 hypothetical protein SETIT_5G185700v2 [Setaria italica]
MADDNSVAKIIGLTGLALSSGASAALATGACSWCALQAYREGRLSRGWWWLRVGSLGGVSTLEQALDYDCALCRRGLDQREEVRTLSCDHVFHLRKSAKCENTIDGWLRENRMRCPVCCKIAYPVLPWKPPPASAPPAPARSPSTTDLEAQLPLPSAFVARPRRQPPRPPSEWFEDTLQPPSPSPSPSPSQ